MTLTFSRPIRETALPAERDLAAIFDLYSKRVVGLCRHMLRDDVLAQDAEGEVFLRVRNAIRTYDETVPMERWVLRIAANHCIDLIRKRRLERRWFSPDASAVDLATREATPLTQLLVKEQREELDRCMARLEEAYRVPLVLRYYADLSYDEIAAELHIEKTQVAGRIFRAKQMLRVMLKETA